MCKLTLINRRILKPQQWIECSAQLQFEFSQFQPVTTNLEHENNCRYYLPWSTHTYRNTVVMHKNSWFQNWFQSKPVQLIDQSLSMHTKNTKQFECKGLQLLKPWKCSCKIERNLNYKKSPPEWNNSKRIDSLTITNYAQPLKLSHQTFHQARLWDYSLGNFSICSG